MFHDVVGGAGDVVATGGCQGAKEGVDWIAAGLLVVQQLQIHLVGLVHAAAGGVDVQEDCLHIPVVGQIPNGGEQPFLVVGVALVLDGAFDMEDGDMGFVGRAAGKAGEFLEDAAGL